MTAKKKPTPKAAKVLRLTAPDEARREYVEFPSGNTYGLRLPGESDLVDVMEAATMNDRMQAIKFDDDMSAEEKRQAIEDMQVAIRDFVPIMFKDQVSQDDLDSLHDPQRFAILQVFADLAPAPSATPNRAERRSSRRASSASTAADRRTGS